MGKSYSGDLTPSGQTVELALRDQPGFGEVGNGTVIAPFAFARLDAATGTGVAMSWVAGTNAGEYDFTFTNAQADTNYTVITDSEYTDDGRYAQIVTKSTSGFTISVYDATNPITPNATIAFGVFVYGADPVIDVVAGDDVIMKSAHVPYVPTASTSMIYNTWTDIPGSAITYTPLSSFSNVHYRYEFSADSANSGDFDLVLRLLVDGVEQDDSFEYNYHSGQGGYKMDYSHSISSWGESTAYEVKLQGQVRFAHRSSVIHPEMPAGEGPASFRQAQLTITEYN